MDDWLRLLTWVVMDGTIVHRSPFNKRVQFHLSKQRKIQSLKDLLNRLKFNYTFREAQKSGINKLQPYYICLYGDEARLVCEALGALKKFPKEWGKLKVPEAVAVIKTIAETDGNKQWNKIGWTSTDLDNIHIIESMCNSVNIPFKYQNSKIGASAFTNAKQQYRATIGYNLETDTINTRESIKK